MASKKAHTDYLPHLHSGWTQQQGKQAINKTIEFSWVRLGAGTVSVTLMKS